MKKKEIHEYCVKMWKTHLSSPKNGLTALISLVFLVKKCYNLN